ncbi:hypothetical protein ES702_04034 [subsurface metagenome]
MKLTRYCVVFSIITLLSFSGFVPTVRAQEDVLETIIQGVKHYDSLLKSGEVTLILKTELADDFVKSAKEAFEARGQQLALSKSSTEEVTIVFNGDKVRCETKHVEIEDNMEPSRDILVYDGEKNLLFVETFTEKVGVIGGKKDTSLMDPIRNFGLALFGKSLSEVLSSSDYKLNLLGQQHVNGAPCYVVEVLREDGTRGKLCIDPLAGYGARRIEVKYNTGGTTVIDTDFQQVSDGLWYPSKGSLLSHRRSDTGMVMTKKKTMELKKANLNIDIPDSYFSIAFPAGTRVADKIAGITFRVPTAE